LVDLAQQPFHCFFTVAVLSIIAISGFGDCFNLFCQDD
jgi:hypothetical protein